MALVTIYIFIFWPRTIKIILATVVFILATVAFHFGHSSLDFGHAPRGNGSWQTKTDAGMQRKLIENAPGGCQTVAKILKNEAALGGRVKDTLE